MKLSSEPILFHPKSLTRIMLKLWLPRMTWMHHEPLVGALHLSWSSSCYFSFWKSCVDEEKESQGKDRDNGALAQSLAGVAIWDDEGWRPDLVKSRLQTVKNSTGDHMFLVSSPLIPQSLSPIHLPEGDKIVNSSYCCGREQAVPPIGYRAAVFLDLMNVSDF